MILTLHLNWKTTTTILQVKKDFKPKTSQFSLSINKYKQKKVFELKRIFICLFDNIFSNLLHLHSKRNINKQTNCC